LRTYQLLVSPSVLNYLTHALIFKPPVPAATTSPGWLQRYRQALFIMSLREWRLDSFYFRWLWQPLKWIGSQITTWISRPLLMLLGILTVVGLVFFSASFSGENWSNVLSTVCFVLGAVLVLSGFAQRGDALTTWYTLVVSQLLILSGAIWAGHFDLTQMLLYAGGLILAAGLGMYCLKQTQAIDGDILLNRHHGYSYEQPAISQWFLVACLGLIGFPITPTFVGVDLLFTRVHSHSWVLVLLLSLNFLLLELALLRIYLRVYMGQHKKEDHPIAFKSA
jgi:NADH-quinone oxidoreductase subunit L